MYVLYEVVICGDFVFFRSLCKPLPLEIGRCTCVIVKEKLPKELAGGALYSL